MPPPYSPSPCAPRVTAQPVAAPPYPAPRLRHCTSPSWPMPRLVLHSFALVCKEHPTASKLDYKGTSPSFARGNTTPPSRHCRPSVLTVNSTSGRFSTQTRAAPASLVHRQSSHASLLATPSCRLSGAELPTAAAAGLHHTRPPVASPP
jgi:hypothetical protein